MERTAPAAPTGIIEMDYSEGSTERSPEASVPEWKKELSRRLQEIKAKRQAAARATPELPYVPETATPEAPAVTSETTAVTPETGPPALPPALPSDSPAGETTPPKPATPRPPRRDYAGTTRRSSTRTQRPIVVQKVEPPGDGLPLFRTVEPEPPPPPAPPPPSDVGSIIDQVIASHMAAGGAGTPAADPARPPADVPAPAPAAKAAPDRPSIVVSYDEGAGREDFGEDRMILLSRTLAGLVDLIVVLGCTTGIIICTDLVAQIEVMDGTSMFAYGGLLLAVFFLYSVYFLGTGGQTMGMMITDLHVVGDGDSRPRLRSILLRTAAFLLSIGLGCAGLLWGFFDKRARCLHDRLSGTHVVRP